MTRPVFVLFLSCLFLEEMVQTTDTKLSSSDRQQRSFVSVKTGDKLTLPCFYEGNLPPRCNWYKQTLGQKVQLISSYLKYETTSAFHGEFQNNSRFTLDTENNKNHFTIKDLTVSDSAVYYCVHLYAYTLNFSESITVYVEDSGSDIPAVVHQSTSESVQPGGSVTLSCTVHTGTCDGEHSVYWFKNSQESHPGLIYTHGGRNDQCERKEHTQTHTCVYNLPMKSLNLSHAGTYYCAVATCGHILLGDGTKLDFEHNVDCVISVYSLSGALAFTTILVVLLAFSLYKMKRNSSHTTESQARVQLCSTDNATGYPEEDNVHYAALSVSLPNRSRRQRNNTESECVYSSVKQ